MDIMEIIKAVLFIAVPLLVILIAGFLGWRRNIIQSGIKLGTVILSVLAAVFIAKVVLPALVDALLSMGNSFIEENIASDFQGSAYAMDLFRLLITMLMPLIFLAIFFVMNALFSLLYLIPGRLFSNKAIARRAASKVAPDPVAVPNVQPEQEGEGVAVETTEQEPAADAAQMPQEPIAVEPAVQPAVVSGPDWKKIGLKASSVACSILAGILVLSSFMLPVSFYAGFAASCVETVDLENLDPDSAEVIEVIHDLDDHFTVNCYQVLNWPASGMLNSFTSHNGTKAIATETVLDVLEIVDSLNTDDLTQEGCYALADKLEKNTFLDETLSGIAVDMVNAWRAGESFIGVESDGMSSETIDLMNSLVSDNRSLSVVMRLTGDMLAMSQSLQSDDPEALGDAIEAIVNNMNSETADAFKELLQTAFAEGNEENANVFADFTGAVMDSIIEIKEDKTLTAEERDDILENEAESLTTIMEIATGEESADMVKLVDACISSAALTDAVKDATENGELNDPYGLADDFTDEMVDEICQKLEQKGIEEDSETYRAFMALIRK